LTRARAKLRISHCETKSRYALALYSCHHEMRHAIIGSCAAIALTIAQFAFAEEPKKDAAGTVGEGNASRWLDFYRRERGEHWDSNSHTKAPGSPTAPAERRDRPPVDPVPGPDKR
jgi:hypothetical protein